MQNTTLDFLQQLTPTQSIAMIAAVLALEKIHRMQMLLAQPPESLRPTLAWIVFAQARLDSKIYVVPSAFSPWHHHLCDLAASRDIENECVTRFKSLGNSEGVLTGMCITRIDPEWQRIFCKLPIAKTAPKLLIRAQTAGVSRISGDLLIIVSVLDTIFVEVIVFFLDSLRATARTSENVAIRTVIPLPELSPVLSILPARWRTKKHDAFWLCKGTGSCAAIVAATLRFAHAVAHDAGRSAHCWQEGATLCLEKDGHVVSWFLALQTVHAARAQPTGTGTAL